MNTWPGWRRSCSDASDRSATGDRQSMETVNEKFEPADTRPRFRWGVALAWILVIALLVILGLGLLRSQRGPVSVGEPVPDFTLTTFDGEEISAAELKGRVVLINFWASWCKPCEREAADLQAAWEVYSDRGDVVFLGVDYIDTEPEARKYLERFAITYPNGPDLGTRIAQAFRIRGVPETYILDREGSLVRVQIGPYTSLAEIRADLDPLLEQ